MGAWSFWRLKMLAAWKRLVVFGVGGFLPNLAGMRGRVEKGVAMMKQRLY